MPSYKKKAFCYTVTAALPYANGPIHIGHLAGAYLPADIYARYLRSKKERVVFIGGSDEHGVPITISAQKEGISPQQVVDSYHALNRKTFEDFGISFDIFSRTSSKLHQKTASDFFIKLYEKGIFEVHETKQFYDQAHQQFLADRYIKGTCPRCNYEEAYGDQCESCGTTLSPNELINPKSVLSGKKPTLKATKHWYLPLDTYEDWLKSWIIKGHQEWKKNVYGQCKSWIDQGLRPRAVTRDLDWGVPVPLQEAKGKVLYVWFDAPIGYISATKEWAATNNQDWEPFWKDPKTKLVHFVGKDNIVFHCIIFPVMLKAHGDFILPENVPANEFLNLEGNKLSTSRNWAVWLHEYLVDFSNKQDVLRYVICANAPEAKDSDFSWKDFQAKNNNELVAILGNFIHRSLVLTHKYFDGIVPERMHITSIDEEVVNQIKKRPDQIGDAIAHFKFKEGIQLLMELARIGNKYLADTEPWKLIKHDVGRVKTILNLTLQLIATMAILAEPFLPFTSKKLRAMLQLNELMWDDAGNTHLLQPGRKIKAPTLLFEKIEDTVIEQQISKLKAHNLYSA